MTNKKILVVEDEALIAADIIDLLTGAGFLKTSGAQDINDAMKEFQSGIPDLVICDINLGNGHSGIDFIREVHKIKPVPVIFLTGLTDEQTVRSALEVSPESYLTKPFTGDQLLVSVKRVINKVYNGKRVLSRLPRPTRREMDIICLIAAGNSSRAIAEKLCISFDTVQTHRKNIYFKYKVSSSAEIIALAHSNNWL